MVLVIHNVQSLRVEVAKRKADGERVALVPTMGALHAGHLSLVEVARQHADAVMVSIFVNPTQFGPNEDYEAYPRVLEEDIAKLEDAQVEMVYLPTVAELYPNGPEIDIYADKALASGLCGVHRAGHFDGVVTVVKRLLEHCRPDVAVFGEKDYQQLQIIKQMVKQQELPVEVIGAPILREADGLAMSSRNAYLSEQERKIAPLLYKALCEVALPVTGHSCAGMTDRLLEAGFTSVDYVELVDATTLQPIVEPDRPARLLAAATLGKTRLIDNIAVEPKDE